MRKLTLAMLLGALGFGTFHLLAPRRHPPLFPQFRREVRDQMTSAVRFATKQEAEGWKRMAAETSKPKLAALPSTEAYRSAIAADLDHPGARSFRADTEVFCQHNQREVEEQARKEGITVDEVKELTFFGFAAMRATQPGKVAEVLGRPLSSEETAKLGRILDEENRAFQQVLHQEVDQGVSLEQRWETIRSFERTFVGRFEQSLGMTPAQFDQMLAPDPEPATRVAVAPLQHAAPPSESHASEPAVPPPSQVDRPVVTLEPKDAPSHMHVAPAAPRRG